MSEQHTSVEVVHEPERDWKMPLLIAITVLSLVAAGTTVGWTLTQQDAVTADTASATEENRDVLVTLCASLTTLRFVFEQLELLDRRLSRDPSLSAEVKAELRTRATLYATAVVALSDTKECRKIE